jgi:hypothetical protein
MSLLVDADLEPVEVATAFTFDQQTGKIALSLSHAGPSDVKWCKLALVHRDHLPGDLQPLLEDAQRSWGSRSAADMIGPFLHALMQRFFDKLLDTEPVSGPCDFHCVFTFPASWRPEDRNRMMAAVEKAHLPSLAETSIFSFDYLSEQEAAALAVFTASSEGSFAVWLFNLNSRDPL